MSGTASDPFLLPNTWVLHVPDAAVTAAGVETTLPSGDVLTPTSSDPLKLGTRQSTVDAAVTIVNALVDGSVAPDTVYTVILSDSAGLKPYTLSFKIVPDTTPTALLESLPGATHTLQDVPPAG